MSDMYGLKKTAHKAMEDAFRLFDSDQSGFIERHQLSLLLRKLTDSFHAQHPSQNQVEEIFKQLDINGDGKISRKQFQLLIDKVIKIMTDLYVQAEKDGKKDVKKTKNKK